ncbi:MarR family winged helix-turn-helix transcriptional regulator [Streptomyces sp. NPDC049936]|uniref:MarR family winged helix-turn-helix transcriptional regulator n=1 Tax=Streptomyces sp. NPDC049936 TaxID=3365599 RepID=UPI0037BB9795
MEVNSPATPPLPSVASLSRDLLTTARLIRACSAEVLAEFGLSDSQAGLLWALDPAGKPQTMRSLALKLTCDPSNVTVLSEALRRAGLIQRYPHPDDRRAKVLTLTELGLDVWGRLQRRLDEASPLGQLSADQRRSLNAILAACLTPAESQAPEG